MTPGLTFDMELSDNNSKSTPLLPAMSNEDHVIVYDDIDNSEHDEVLSQLTSSMDSWSGLRRKRQRGMTGLGDSDDEDDNSVMIKSKSMSLKTYGGRILSESKRKLLKRHKYCKIKCLNFIRVPTLRQQWIEVPGEIYLNSSIHDERRPRWMDLLFDLVLVGFQIHIWKLFVQMLPDAEVYDTFGFLISGYGIVALLWQTVQKYRNRYHSSGLQDTFILIFMIILAVIAIRDLHHCTIFVTCSAIDILIDHQCHEISLGISLLYIFYGLLNLWVASFNKKFRLNNIYEAIWFFISSMSWLVVVIIPVSRKIFRMNYVLSTLLLLICRPALVSIVKKLKDDFQPQNVSYLRERLGLLVIVNLAIVIEQSFETECIHSNFHLCDHAMNGSTAIHTPRRLQAVAPEEVDENSLSKVFLGFTTLFLAFFMKVLYFNVYDYSEMEEQVSKYTYQPINGIRLTLVYFLSIGFSLLSADEKITLCQLSDMEDIHGKPTLTYTCAIVILTITFTIHHYTNTKRAKKKWHSRKFWTFICLRFFIVFACIIFDLIFSTDAYSYHIFVFMILFLVSLSVEQYILKLPMRYGAKRDKELRSKLNHLAEKAGKSNHV